MAFDPMSSGAPDPLDAGQGDKSEEMHMRAFKKAFEKGDSRGMRDAMKAFFESCYGDILGNPGSAPEEENPGNPGPPKPMY